ncbi:MAG: 23S rRNA (pseudouridine(1915)-N(3))-methyltransferase RlmH [Oscillospiraceae bacterium]
MIHIYLLCVGKLKEKFYADAVAEYQKRLSSYCKLDIIELAEEKLPQGPSQALIDAALGKEAAAIRAKLPPKARTVALCIEGQLLSSGELSKRLRTWEAGPSNQLCFLIGGSYGLDEQLKAEAQVRVSMSPMTFPHHLARVMLLEQLYRSFKINEGGSYHK